MTEMLDKIREAAMVLPAVEEHVEGETHVFYVADQPFVRVEGDKVAFRSGDGITIEWGSDMPLADVGFPWSSDPVGRAWERVAPPELLEAGGR